MLQHLSKIDINVIFFIITRCQSFSLQDNITLKGVIFNLNITAAMTLLPQENMFFKLFLDNSDSNILHETIGNIHWIFEDYFYCYSIYFGDLRIIHVVNETIHNYSQWQISINQKNFHKVLKYWVCEYWYLLDLYGFTSATYNKGDY